MKTTRQILVGSLLLIGLQFGLSSCVTHGYIGVSSGVYYGPLRDPWFHDDPWVDGHHWYGGPRVGSNLEVYIHPPRHRR